MWNDNRTVSWSNWGQGEPVINTGTNCAFVEKFLDFPKVFIFDKEKVTEND